MHSFSLAVKISTLAFGSVFATDTVTVPRDTTHTAPAVSPPVSPPRLGVRPHEMATGIRTVRAGLDTLDAQTLVYVPAQCVGTQRVPLVVYLGGAGFTAQHVIDIHRPQADKYGMIILAPEARSAPGMWDVIAESMTDELGPELGPMLGGVSASESQRGTYPDAKTIDAAIQKALRQFAIDPQKIAIAGFSNGGSYALFLGRSNLDVFSRVVGLSAITPLTTTGPREPKTQFLISAGAAEDNNVVQLAVKTSQAIRRDGNQVETILAFRAHVAYPVEDDYVGSWLRKSWGLPTAAADARTRIGAGPDPLLTVEALAKMNAFWTSFFQEPDSIKIEGRLAHQEQIPMIIGEAPVSVLKADLAALVARYPSVAVDLTNAKLTVQQAEAYQATIMRLVFTRMAGTVADTSVLGKNLAFVQTHQEAFKMFETINILQTQ